MVVAVGASAGGFEAITELLAGLRSEMRLAIVIVQHLDSGGESLLMERLQSNESRPIVLVDRPRSIQAGTIYLAPGGHDIELRGARLCPPPVQSAADRAAGKEKQPKLRSIDAFFYSLAECKDVERIGVILSGAGNDGTFGLKAISDAGGMTFAQEPHSAQFDSMPRNAATTGVADHVLTPSEIARELISYVNFFESEKSPGTAKEARLRQIEESIPQIAARLQKVTDHNFQHYKMSTLVRRINRRMQVLKIADVSDYVIQLERDANETQQLFRELLIGVTAFFRDVEAFDSLAKTVLPDLFAHKSADDHMRIWVPGCARGQEAYSLAMLCCEHLDQQDRSIPVQIFASDIDEHALSAARQGAYPLAIANQISADRLERFFIKRGNRYHVTTRLREMVLFSSHNLISDPPFSRLDLVSCRNLLIYLGPHLQKKLIPLFHFSLRPGGYLFLGPSESIATHGDLFRSVDKRHRISQRKGTPVTRERLLARTSKTGAELGKPISPLPPLGEHHDLNQVMQRILLDEFSPKCVIIDGENKVLCASAETQKYLTVTAGSYENNLIKMARQGLRIGLRAAIADAKKTLRRTTHENLSVQTTDGKQQVMLTVQPMPEMGEDSDLLMVVFHDVGLPIRTDQWTSADDSGGADRFEKLVAQLEKELDTARADLESTMQEMEAANEELKSSNEELLSMNEELQSANEELETSKEEIRSGSEAVSRANDDLENLLRSTEIATVFLDNDKNIRSFTPAIESIYSLIETDVGRPLEKFVPSVADMPPLPDFAELLRRRQSNDDSPVEHAVRAGDGSCYLRRVNAYRNREGEVDGMVVTFTDVTELRRSQDELAETQARFKLAMQVSGAAAWAINVETGAVVSNANLERLFGVEPGSNPPLEAYIEKIDRSDQQRIRNAINRSIRDGNEYDVEYRVFPGDDEVRWVRAVGQVAKRPGTTPAEFTGVIIDITEQKQWEQELVRRERQLRQVMDGTPNFIGVLDTDGIMHEVNQPALDAGGMSRSEAIGKPFATAKWWSFDPKVSDQMNDMIKSAAAGQSIRHDMRYRVNDGSIRWVDFSLNPIRDDDGNVIYLIPSGTDITDRKKAERDVRLNEQRLRLAAAAAGFGMLYVDFDKDTVTFSREVNRIVGYPTDHDFGLKVGESPSFIHPDDIEALRDHFQNVQLSLDSVDGASFEHRIIRKDGQVRWVKLQSRTFFRGEGERRRPTSMVGMLIDITTQHEYEKSIQEAKAAAESANRQKSSFVANMSHEIRTPMTAILGYTDLLSDFIESDEGRKYLKTIRRNGDYLLDIINDILDLSKIEAGKFETETERFEPARLIEDVRSIMEVRARQEQLDLVVEYDGRLPKMIQSDAKRLKQILINLVGNAIKFTSKGRVGVRVRCTQLGDSQPELCFDVTDTGVGISQEQQEKLFKPFSQADSSVTRNYGGTGLGLAISKRLAALLGGDLRVSSTEGVGSTFTVSIPVVVNADTAMVDYESILAVPPTPGPETPSSIKRASDQLECHALIVDDRRDIRFLSKRILVQNGATIDEAEDGVQAMEYMSQKKASNSFPDVVLLDMQMPRMDGYTTARELRKLGYEGPIIALTADAMHGDMNECLEAGCNDYLSKPINAKKLVELVAEMTQ